MNRKQPHCRPVPVSRVEQIQRNGEPAGPILMMVATGRAARVASCRWGGAEGVPQRIGAEPQRLSSRPPSAIAMTTMISAGRGASASDTVIVSKCSNDHEIVLVPERHIERSAGRGDFYIGRDDRLATADRRTHRSSQHRMDAGAAMLHFAIDADQRSLAIGNRRPIEQFDQLRHDVLAEFGTCFP